MPTAQRKQQEKKLKPEENKLPAKYYVDWARIDAMTDEDIARQIAEDPDVAPELDWPLDDPAVRAMVPIDVKAIRAKLGMSQEEFAKAFGLALAELREWEQQGRVAWGPSLTLLRIIDREPEAARRALGHAAAAEPVASGS